MIKAKLNEDVKNAMRARDTMAINTIRGVLSEIKRFEIDTRTEADSEKVITIVQKEVKKRRESIEAAEKAQRADIIEQNNAELKILLSYLGDQLSDEKLSEIVQSLVAGGADNIGKIMGALNKDHKGKFDGKAASEIARRILGN